MATFDDDWVTSHVTVRDVILHRTGVGRTYDELWLMNDFDRRDIVRNIKNMESSSNFRSAASYNNVIYSLAGHVIEQLGGADKSWESLVRELVLDPLRMTQTSFYHDRDEPHRFAQPYLHPHGDALPWIQPSALPRGIWSVSSAVSLCSTPRDMAHWVAALLHSASHSTVDCRDLLCRVLPPSVIRETFRPQIIGSHMMPSHIRRPHTDVPFDVDSYGLGWFTGHYRGWKTVLHYGSLIGAYSLLTLLPELQLGVFSSYNGASQHDPYTINSLLHVHVIDSMLGAEPSVNASYWCSHLNDRHSGHSTMDETRGSPRYSASAYVGVYWHRVLGQFDVWDNGTETLMASYGSLEVTLQPLQSGLAFTGVPTDEAWVMLLHDVRVEFEAVNGDHQCRRVSVDLLKLTTFERRRHDDNPVASAAPPTLSLCSVTVLMFVIITTVSHNTKKYV